MPGWATLPDWVFGSDYYFDYYYPKISGGATGGIGEHLPQKYFHAHQPPPPICPKIISHVLKLAQI